MSAGESLSRRAFVAHEYPDCAESRMVVESVFSHRRSGDKWLSWTGTFGRPSRFQAFFRAADGEWSVIDETFRRRTFPPCDYTTFHDIAWKAWSTATWKTVAYDPWLARGRRPVPLIRQVGRPSDGLRRTVLDRDDHRCRWCTSDATLHLDHVVPRRFGGLNSDANCQILCHRCNQLKRTMDDWHFGIKGREYRRRITRSMHRLGMIMSPFRDEG